MKIGGPAGLLVALTVLVSNTWIYFHGHTVGRPRRWVPPGRAENITLVLVTLAVTVVLGSVILSQRRRRTALAHQIGIVYFIVAFALAIASWWLT